MQQNLTVLDYCQNLKAAERVFAKLKQFIDTYSSDYRIPEDINFWHYAIILVYCRALNFSINYGKGTISL